MHQASSTSITNALKAEWAQIPRDMLPNLSENLSRRLEVMITAKSDYVYYGKSQQSQTYLNNTKPRCGSMTIYDNQFCVEQG